MIQNLPNLILANISNLKLDHLFSESNKDILRFYLNKDISTFFGKTDFVLFQINGETPELHYKCINKDENNGEFLIEINGEEYVLKGNRFGFMIKNVNNPYINAFICYYNDTNSFVNELYYQSGDNIIHERQRVYINEKKGFEYKKSVKSEFGKMRYPIYQLRFISKDDYDQSYYEIYSINKDKENNIIKRIIDRVSSYSIKTTSSENEHNLECIFDILESKTNNKGKNLVLKK